MKIQYIQNLNDFFQAVETSSVWKTTHICEDKSHSAIFHAEIKSESK